MAEATKQSQTETKIIETPTGDVHVTQPKGKQRHGVTILLEPDELVREQVGGFANFLREYAVVGLAIGFVVGQQANAVMKQLVDSFVKPWVAVLFGDDLNKRVAVLHHGTAPVPLPWGAFIYSFIDFFFVVVAIYVVIKLFRLDKLKKRTKKRK